MNKKLTLIVYAAMMAAITCVATMIIKVPTVGTQGYVNIGDAAVLLSAWLLFLPYGPLAAGIGSGLADLLSGYASYVPGTTVIKFLMAFAAYLIYKAGKKTKMPQVVTLVISAIVAEIIMIAGYLFYEAFLLGYGWVALESVISNVIQGGTCIVLGVLMKLALSLTPLERQINSLKAEKRS